MKYSKNLTSLQFKFWIRLQSFKRKIENKNIFVEAKTLNDRDWHLDLEMMTLRTAHADRERENTSTK
jgi:hypothetical protein